ncbi:50S ribosomal protein L23 [Candidatus Woesearchaeota archaeon]|nr:50S ribosomal protein L23 [Candidatus Woesearchaeota archaeon]
MTIKHPLATEKSIRMMEASNTLVFVVEKQATKVDIKEAIEKAFTAKVSRVRTQVDRQGQKRAYVTFAKETPAIDIATNLGLM